MRYISIALSTVSLCYLVEPNCLEFWQNWKTCSSDQFPDIPREVMLCFHEVSYSSEVLITRENEKQSAVICYNRTFPSHIFDCLPMKDSSLLVLKNCPFPPPNFQNIFGSTNSTLKALQIQYNDLQYLHNSLHITGIPFLQSLIVSNIRSTKNFYLLLDSLPSMTFFTITNHNFTVLSEKLFVNVPQLQSLTISEGILKILPSDIFYGINPLILDLSFNQLKEFPPHLLQSLNGLKKLNLSHNCIESIAGSIFEATPHLEIVAFDHNNITTLPSKLFGKTPNITILFLNHNRLQNIPDTAFTHLYHLKILSLNNNQLTVLPHNVFNDLASLLWLDLQFNKISQLSTDQLNWLDSLHVIDLSDNRISAFPPSLTFGKSKFLSKINISGNLLEEIPNFHWLQYNISHLDFSRNSIRQIVLPLKTRPETAVLLEYNKIGRVIIDRPLKGKSLYYLQGNPFNCSCSLSDFIHFMPFLTVIDAEKLKCNTPWYRNHKYVTEFTNVAKLCEIKDECPSNCECQLSINDQVTLDCANSKMNRPPQSFPPHTTIIHFENNSLTSLSGYDWPEVTHLYLTNNSLASLHNWTIPPNLELLAIDGNKLSHLPSALMETVDDSPHFRLFMAYNEWSCDCNSIHLKKWLMRNLPKVQDSMNTYCRGYGFQTQESLIVETRSDEFVCSSALNISCVNAQLYIIPSVIVLLIAILK